MTGALATGTETDGEDRAARLQRRTKCLWIRTLEFVRNAEEEMFIGHGADELEPNG